MKRVDTMRTPLGRVRGLGSAKAGLAHWYWQRLSAVALAPLTLWALYLVTQLVGSDYETIRATVARPGVAILLISFVVCLFYHGALGLTVVIEDYIHERWLELVLSIAVKFSGFLLATASVLAIVRVVLGG